MSIINELFESIKKPFLKQPLEKIDADLPLGRVVQNLSNDHPTRLPIYFDSLGTLTYSDAQHQSSEQAQKINIYRQCAKIAEVWDGITEIVDEVTYSKDFKEPLKIEINLKNEKIENAVRDSFEKILRLMNIKKYFHQFVRCTYIDGQMNVLLKFDDKTGGISQIYLLDPRNLWFDYVEQVYKYIDYFTNSSFKSSILSNSQLFNYFKYNKTKPDGARAFNNVNDKVEYTFRIEELVHQNFGLYSDNGICLGELEATIKPANQLKTLEDLLIPLRFSRSISRRVFNVDVSELPNSKAESYMNKLIEKFKYNKQYNADTGEVTNNQHITTMIEDYWVGNKSGAKGMQVDVLDETGNLGELGDIMYFYKLLYRSMGIPSNRIFLGEESQQPLFDTNSEAVTNEDIRFFQRITRIRQVYTEFLTQILKRDLISSGKCSEDQFDDEIKDKINIYFSEENQFIDRMNTGLFMKKIDAFASAKDSSAAVLPIKMLYKEIFKFTDDEIEKILKDIQKEAKDPLLKKFYDDMGFESNDEYPEEQEQEEQDTGEYNNELEVSDKS